MTKKEQFIVWLGDAHAMEVGMVTTLQKQIADAKGHPKIRSALTKHLAETKRHANEMKKALAAMGGSHPILKEGVSKIANMAAGLVPTLAKDTLVKDAIAAFAAENFEIACYNSLIFTAISLGEKRIAATCKSILKDELAMAALLAKQLKFVNDTYLATLDPESAPEKPRVANRDTAGKKRK